MLAGLSVSWLAGSLTCFSRRSRIISVSILAGNHGASPALTQTHTNSPKLTRVSVRLKQSEQKPHVGGEGRGKERKGGEGTSQAKNPPPQNVENMTGGAITTTAVCAVPTGAHT